MRDLKELHWRSRGPRLPQTVLDAATLRIGAALPDTYRQFLSQVDGGRIGRGGFKASEKAWVIGGFFPFADAAGLAEKLRKSGKLPNFFLPVAYSDSPDKPLVYLELHGGRVFLKPSTRTRWDEAGAVTQLGDSFAEFLCLLGDVPKDLPVAAPEPEPTNGAEPPVSAVVKRPAPTTSSKPITSPAAAAARAVAAAAKAAVRATVPTARKLPAKAAPAPALAPAPKAASKPVPKPRGAKAAKPAAKAKAATSAKAKAKKAPARKTKATAKAGRGKAKAGARARR